MRLYSGISPTFKLILKYFNAGKKNTKLQVLGGAETLSASHTTVVSAPGAHDKGAVTRTFYEQGFYTTSLMMDHLFPSSYFCPLQPSYIIFTLVKINLT